MSNINNYSQDHNYYGKKRGYIKLKTITDLCNIRLKYQGKGITFKDLMIYEKCAEHKARRTIKYFHDGKVLFTARDLAKEQIDNLDLKNTRPQQYFLTSSKAKIIEKYKKKTSIYNNALPTSLLVEEKKNIFLEILQKLNYTPLFIHKLQLKTTFDKSHYQWIKENVLVNMSKYYYIYFDEHWLKRAATFYFFPNGTMMSYILCSKYPIRIDTENDIDEFYILLGEIEGLFSRRFNTSTYRTFPPILEWKLQNCDFNKDIEIDSKCQITLPNIQMREAARVFRMYVKPVEDKVVYRLEDSATPNETLGDFLNNIRNQSIQKENIS
ncbi:MAG: hypothetical protein AB7V56_08090 [Candidatus Nitrosocosmicus sp.]